MDGVTLQVIINDFSTEITINVPKEAEEIANIGNDQDQFDNLDKEPDVDHSCYFVLVKVFVLCQNWIIINYPAKVACVDGFDFFINSVGIENF